VRTVGIVRDLMDRSRLVGALPALEFVDDPRDCVDAELVVIDFGRSADTVRKVRDLVPGARIVAFGPHVDDELAARARADGADLVIARSRLFRNPAAVLAPTSD
jgi:hypothetical protein